MSVNTDEMLEVKENVGVYICIIAVAIVSVIFKELLFAQVDLLLYCILVLFITVIAYLWFPRFCKECRSKMKRERNKGFFPDRYVCVGCQKKITMKIENGNWA